MSATQRLHEAVSAACPVAGVRVGSWADRSTWGFAPLPGATDAQKAAAQAAIDAFDDSDEAQAVWEADQKPERKSLRQAAAQAVSDIDAYLAAADSGTANQIQQRDHAAVKRLAQMMKAVIQRLVQID